MILRFIYFLLVTKPKRYIKRNQEVIKIVELGMLIDLLLIAGVGWKHSYLFILGGLILCYLRFLVVGGDDKNSHHGKGPDDPDSSGGPDDPFGKALTPPEAEEAKELVGV